MTELASPKRCITLKECFKRLGRSRATLYAMLDVKSPCYDPQLPLPIKIGRSVLFIEGEVDAYIEKKMAQRAQVAAK